MYKYQINTTSVYIAPITSREGISRRQAEVEARDKLLIEAVGPDARLIHTPEGAPTLADSNLHISISHSQEYIAIAINAQRHIGIDIESQREQLHRVVRKFLNTEEQAIYNTPELLLRAWTLKEALYKACLDTRLGFVQDLHIPLDLNNDITKITTPEGVVTHYQCQYFTFREQAPRIGVAVVEEFIP